MLEYTLLSFTLQTDFNLKTHCNTIAFYRDLNLKRNMKLQILVIFFLVTTCLFLVSFFKLYFCFFYPFICGTLSFISSINVLRFDYSKQNCNSWRNPECLASNFMTCFVFRKLFCVFWDSVPELSLIIVLFKKEISHAKQWSIYYLFSTLMWMDVLWIDTIWNFLVIFLLVVYSV